MPCDSNGAMTCSPSVTAELDAKVPLSLCEASCGSASRAVCSQTTLPSSDRSPSRRSGARRERAARRAARAHRRRPSPPARRSARRRDRPRRSATPEPRPGISTFQRTFFVSLHSVGGVGGRRDAAGIVARATGARTARRLLRHERHGQCEQASAARRRRQDPRHSMQGASPSGSPTPQRVRR